MKEGRSLVELAGELERQQESKRDFLADTRSLSMTNGGDLEITNGDRQTFNATDHCHGQIGARLNIPKRYYDKMRQEAPDLLAHNVNAWFQRRPERRMVRTLDGRARAFLSDRYRPLDNFDLATAVLPRLSKSECEIKSAQLTESRLYIQAVTQKIEGEIKKGDVVQAGIVVSNSEIGAGSVRVEPMLYRLVCTNGMICPDMGMKKYHVGRANRGIDLDGAHEFFKDSTRKLDDRAFWAKICDVVEATLSMDGFDTLIEKMRAAAEKSIEGDPVKAVEVLANKLTFTENEQGSVLRHLIAGGDLSQWGLANAVTRTASDLDDYDRAVEFERIGGNVIELPRTEWESIAKAS